MQKNENRAKHKFLRKAMCCNLQHFFQNKATDSRSVLSHDAISCVLSNIESQEKPVNTDVFATSENVQIQKHQIPTPPMFSAVEAYEML